VQIMNCSVSSSSFMTLSFELFSYSLLGFLLIHCWIREMTGFQSSPCSS
jgi:hypothetical protein